MKYSIDTQTDPFITVLNLLKVSEKRDIDTEQKKILKNILKFKSV